jgi:hypothetical protein
MNTWTLMYCHLSMMWPTINKLSWRWLHVSCSHSVRCQTLWQHVPNEFESSIQKFPPWLLNLYWLSPGGINARLGLTWGTCPLHTLITVAGSRVQTIHMSSALTCSIPKPFKSASCTRNLGCKWLRAHKMYVCAFLWCWQSSAISSFFHNNS